jgi:hypothetical protein
LLPACCRLLWLTFPSLSQRASFNVQAVQSRTQLREKDQHIKFLMDENAKLAALHQV